MSHWVLRLGGSSTKIGVSFAIFEWDVGPWVRPQSMEAQEDTIGLTESMLISSSKYSRGPQRSKSLQHPKCALGMALMRCFVGEPVWPPTRVIFTSTAWTKKCHGATNSSQAATAQNLDSLLSCLSESWKGEMTSLTCHFHRYTNVFFSHDPTFTGQRCSTDIGRHLRSATCCEPPFPPRSAHDLKDPKGDVLREGHTEEFQKISIYLSIHPSIYLYLYVHICWRLCKLCSY